MRRLAAIVATTAAVLAAFAVPASAQTDLVWRKNAAGKMVQIRITDSTFEGCVRGGMKLGYPRIGPGGPTDSRGAVGYCRRRFPQ